MFTHDCTARLYQSHFGNSFIVCYSDSDSCTRRELKPKIEANRRANWWFSDKHAWNVGEKTLRHKFAAAKDGSLEPTCHSKEYTNFTVHADRTSRLHTDYSAVTDVLRAGSRAYIQPHDLVEFEANGSSPKEMWRNFGEY